MTREEVHQEIARGIQPLRRKIANLEKLLLLLVKHQNWEAWAKEEGVDELPQVVGAIKAGRFCVQCDKPLDAAACGSEHAVRRIMAGMEGR